MTGRTRITIGQAGFEEAAAAFLDTWHRAASGEAVAPQRILTFESLEAMASVLTPERMRLLKHVRQHPARSIRALSQELQRDYRRVHGDVVALENAGLLERSAAGLQATADRLTVDVDLVA
ncbi:HVO_A0114 family putative DNA-binding protein [Siccirubricoccus phaeus]|uniref:HVO_A0114 family putative DNA-binding protein n=1 Tax=Siccirubricoccus phaeus TaxID=2595053 RepID=UPI0011F403D2|nr:hypothetical protein [Siccirubricoccus phaeus]